MQSHYTAVIEVTQTVITPEVKDRNDRVTTAHSRDVFEVARFTVRAPSLAELVVMAHQHVELVAPAPVRILEPGVLQPTDPRQYRDLREAGTGL